MKIAQSLSSVLAAAVVVLTGCSHVDQKVRAGQVVDVLDQNAAGRSFIETIGIGASDPKLPTATQRKALARDAAIVKAQYEMLAMVKGVELEGGVKVDRALETDSGLTSRLRETIAGAEIVKSEYTSDDGCVVTLRLPKKRLERLMGVAFR